jgi:hypothetical protein
MYNLLTIGWTAQILGTSAGVAIAVTLLGLLVALSIYAGLYYSVPKMLVKWLTRLAIPVV